MNVGLKPNVRISVHLTHFFTDHRQLARIFINDNFKIIQDLEHHLKKVFKIESEFNLLCQNHFLPSDEDIRILNDGDAIFAIPQSTTKDHVVHKGGLNSCVNALLKSNENSSNHLNSIGISNLTVLDTAGQFHVNKRKEVITHNDEKIRKRIAVPANLISEEQIKKCEALEENQSPLLVTKHSEKPQIGKSVSEIMVHEREPVVHKDSLTNMLATLKSIKKAINDLKSSGINNEVLDSAEQLQKVKEVIVHINERTKKLIAVPENVIVEEQIKKKKKKSQVNCKTGSEENQIPLLVTQHSENITSKSLTELATEHPILVRSVFDYYALLASQLELQKGHNNSSNSSDISNKIFDSIEESKVIKNKVAITHEDEKTKNLNTAVENVVTEEQIKKIKKSQKKKCKTVNEENILPLVITEHSEKLKNVKHASDMKTNFLYETNSNKQKKRKRISDSGRFNMSIEDFLQPIHTKEDGFKSKTEKQANLLTNENNQDVIENNILEKNVGEQLEHDVSMEVEYRKEKIKVPKTNESVTIVKEQVCSNNIEMKNLESSKTYNLSDVVNFNGNKTFKSLEKSVQNPKYKLFSIGHVMNNLSFSGDEKMDYITQRKRTRIRHRKRKSTKNEEVNETVSEHSFFRPPKTAAAPLSHVRFSENEFENSDIDDISPTNIEEYSLTPNVTTIMGRENGFSPDVTKISENDFTHSTPYPVKENDMSIIADEQKAYDDFLKNINVTSYKILSEPPSIKDTFIFKKLKLTENYTPQISDYILAEVLEVLSDRKTIKIKIQAGHDELREPAGKFSCDSNEQEDEQEEPISTLFVEWNTVIEPRLINPGEP